MDYHPEKLRDEMNYTLRWTDMVREWNHGSFEWRNLIHLSTKDLAKLIDDLEHPETCVRSLCIMNSHISNQQCTRLVGALRTNGRVERLSIMGCHIGDHGIIEIAKYLEE